LIHFYKRYYVAVKELICCEIVKKYAINSLKENILGITKSIDSITISLIN